MKFLFISFIIFSSSFLRSMQEEDQSLTDRFLDCFNSSGQEEGRSFSTWLKDKVLHCCGFDDEEDPELGEGGLLDTATFNRALAKAQSQIHTNYGARERVFFRSQDLLDVCKGAGTIAAGIGFIGLGIFLQVTEIESGDRMYYGGALAGGLGIYWMVSAINRRDFTRVRQNNATWRYFLGRIAFALTKLAEYGGGSLSFLENKGRKAVRLCSKSTKALGSLAESAHELVQLLKARMEAENNNLSQLMTQMEEGRVQNQQFLEILTARLESSDRTNRKLMKTLRQRQNIGSSSL